MKLESDTNTQEGSKGHCVQLWAVNSVRGGLIPEATTGMDNMCTGPLLHNVCEGYFIYM